MKKILVFILLTLLFLFKPQVIFAETIHSFDTNIVAHKNGLMDITETINYDFEGAYRHGIFRNIPLFSKVGQLYRNMTLTQIKVLRDGKPENFQASYSQEEVSIKIGNKDKLILGDYIYTIFYTVKNAVGSNFPDHDEIYWNATGNDWETTIEKATSEVSTDFGVTTTNFICFEGPLGSSSQSCKVTQNSAAASQALLPGYGLTVVAVYPPNTFPKSILSNTLPPKFGDIILNIILKYYYLIWIFLNIIVPAGLIYWYQKHKNKKRFGPPSVNFDIPRQDSGIRIAPALSGTIDSAKLEKDDITATIFDLAIRKYIKIEQIKEVKSLLPDKIDQKIIKLKVDNVLEPFEKTLMDRLFQDADSVKVSDLKTDFYITFQQMEKEVFEVLVKKGYYTKNPKTQKQFLLVFSLIALFFGNIVLSPVLFFLSLKLNGRTVKGDEADFKIDGLKLFLKSMDRNYKWQAEKFYTVEQMIPYAVALGFIDQFLQALKILNPNYKPGWYGGTGNFYMNYALFSSVASSNFTTSAPSSSSGSSGGFSGGGGGGGGGGSW